MLPFVIFAPTFFLLTVQEAAAQPDAGRIAAWSTWLTETGPALASTPPNFGQSFGRQGDRRPTSDDLTSIRWTRMAIDLIAQQRLNPLLASRVLALLHTAMHDALVRGVRRGQDERIAWVAVHRAASLVLADLFPEQSPERFEALGLGAAAAIAAFDPAKALTMWQLGSDVARDAATRARSDGSDRVWALDRRPAPAPGRWRPTPPINAFNPLEPLAGEWLPWVLASGGAVEPLGPVPYDSPRFWEEVEEVRRFARSLTPAQKAIAEAWNLDFGTVTPAGVWNLKGAELAEQTKLEAPETLRMFAALNVAVMDAFIACWHVKYKWWTARPITVIRERYDSRFLSHLLTPAFPSYISGHASVSGAAGIVLARFFPERADWLRAQAAEAAESRLLGGIHFRSDNEAGLELGREVGRRVVGRVFLESSPRP